MSERTQGPPIQFRSAEVEPQLGVRLDARIGSPGRVAVRDLDRYYTVLTAELARLDLSEPEAMLIIDSLNGSLLDTSSYRLLWAEIDDALDDGLAEKWGIDGFALVAKLRALSPAQAMAVIDAGERWWIIQSAADEGEGDVPAERDNRARVVGLVR